MTKRWFVSSVAIIFLLTGCSASVEELDADSGSPTPSESFDMGVDTGDVDYYQAGDGYQAALDELPSPEMIPTCADAFDLAASIPAGETNDAEMYRTGRYCDNVQEWKLTLLDYPGALGVTAPTIDDAYATDALVALCALEDASYTLTCRDAAQRGIIAN